MDSPSLGTPSSSSSQTRRSSEDSITNVSPLSDGVSLVGAFAVVLWPTPATPPLAFALLLHALASLVLLGDPVTPALVCVVLAVSLVSF